MVSLGFCEYGEHFLGLKSQTDSKVLLLKSSQERPWHLKAHDLSSATGIYFLKGEIQEKGQSCQQGQKWQRRELTPLTEQGFPLSFTLLSTGSRPASVQEQFRND